MNERIEKWILELANQEYGGKLNELLKALEIEARRTDYEYNDLMNDFEFVKDLNKQLSLRYQDFVDSLPKPQEVQLLIDTLKMVIARETDKNRLEYLNKRLFQLTRFKTAAIILEQDDNKNKPISYEELLGKGI